MIEHNMIELMNLVIDGVATPAQRATLDKYLAAHPEALAYYEALARLVARLNADPVPDPPSGLETGILDAVHLAPARGPARGKETSTPWLRSLLAPGLRPWSTFGLGLAAGVLLLVAVQYGRPGFFASGRDIDPAQVSGSIVSRVVEPVGTVPVSSSDGTVSGSAVIYGRGADMVVDVKLQSTVPVEWTLSYDGDAWTLDRVERHGTATSAFAANRDSVQGLHTGEGGVTLVFAGPPKAAEFVVLKVLQGGQPVFEGGLTPMQ